jgi:hypothetical protein
MLIKQGKIGWRLTDLINNLPFSPDGHEMVGSKKFKQLNNFKNSTNCSFSSMNRM